MKICWNILFGYHFHRQHSSNFLRFGNFNVNLFSFSEPLKHVQEGSLNAVLLAIYSSFKTSFTTLCSVKSMKNFRRYTNQTLVVHHAKVSLDYFRSGYSTCWNYNNCGLIFQVQYKILLYGYISIFDHVVRRLRSQKSSARLDSVEPKFKCFAIGMTDIVYQHVYTTLWPGRLKPMKFISFSLPALKITACICWTSIFCNPIGFSYIYHRIIRSYSRIRNAWKEFSDFT